MVKYVDALTDTDSVKNGFGDPGDTITYSYKVINTGPLGLSGLTATDSPLGPIVGCPATLAAGTVTDACDPKTVVVAAGAGTPLSNTATVSARLPSGMVPAGDHDDGTPPYSYTSDMSDPILQIMDPIDGATQNGSEQIYLPASAWRPTTNVLAWDPDHPDAVAPGELGRAAALVYGRGFGDPTNGLVMYQGGHDYTGSGTTAAKVAAQRTFLNFNLLAGVDRSPVVEGTVNPDQVQSGQTVDVSTSTTGGTAPYTYKWASSCGGTFVDDTAASTVFTAPSVVDDTPCTITVTVTDACGRVSFDADPLLVRADPFINLKKTAGTASNQDANGDYHVTYTLTVENTHGAVGSYGPITDTPQFAPNLDPVGITWTAGAPAGFPSGSQSGSGPYTIGSGTVAIAGHATHTYTVTIAFRYADTTQAAACSGPNTGLFNSVSLAGGQEQGSTADNSACVPPPPPPQPPDLNLRKLPGSTTQTPDPEGDYVVTYNVTVTNTGGPTVYGPITDTPNFDSTDFVVTQIDWERMDLPPPHAQGTDATAPYTIGAAETPIGGGTSANPLVHTYEVRITYHYQTIGEQATPCGGAGTGLHNSVSLPAGQEQGGAADNAACVEPPPPSNVELHLDKASAPVVDANNDGMDSAGDTIQFTFSVTNPGEVPIANVVVNDPPTGSDQSLERCNAPPQFTGGDTNANGLLDPADAETWVYTCTHTITQAEVDAAVVTNTATASGTFNGTPLTSNEASTSTPLTPNPMLALDKSLATPADPIEDANASGRVDEGDTVAYTYEVTNTGNVTLSGVTLGDDTCASPDLVSGDGGVTGEMEVGETWVFACTYVLTQADLDRGFVLNIATADSDQSAPDSDQVDLPVPQEPAMVLVKDLGDTPPVTDENDNGRVDAGDSVQYHYLVSNTGTVSITDPAVIDDRCVGLSLRSGDAGAPDVLDPGEIWFYTCIYELTQADLDAGSVTNIAFAAGTDPDGQPVTSNTDTETVALTQVPALSLVKSITGGDPFDSVGDVVSYDFVVTNTGNVRLAGPVSVADDQASDESCPALDTVGNGDGFLDPGEQVTCTASYPMTQADLDAGSVTNVASASAGGTTSNTDTQTAVGSQTPGLLVEKSATESSFAAVGEVIHYSIW